MAEVDKDATRVTTEVPSAQPAETVDVDVNVEPGDKPEMSEPSKPQPDEGAAPGQTPDDGGA